MKSDSRSKIVSEWEENFFFDVDDPDFSMGPGQHQQTTQQPAANRLISGTVSQPNLHMCSLIVKGR